MLRLRGHFNILKRAFSAKPTPLFDLHVANGGKMVDFAGFALPVEYAGETIVASHRHTRRFASLFDVSHMLQTRILGKDRFRFLESLTVADLQGARDGDAVLTLFTNDDGGIEDDLIATRSDSDESVFVVSNAARRDEDLRLMRSGIRDEDDVRIEVLERALLALQGPESARVLQRLLDFDLTGLKFMKSRVGVNIAGIEDCRVTRCGYTGEDGFEISIEAEKASILATTLLENKEVALAGLGARDSLRLEAGLCLYGDDINSETTPVEAGLAWTIAKRRRQSADFPGAKVIMRQMRDKSTVLKKRVGLVMTSKGPSARKGVNVLDEESGRLIGRVTSGCPAPSLDNVNVAIAYVEAARSKVGTKVGLEIRKKKFPATVTKTPFVAANYFT